jgi:hypothetical protein
VFPRSDALSDLANCLPQAKVNESKTNKSRGPNPVIFLFFARIGSEVVAAQGLASKRFFAIFGKKRAAKRGRFLGFGFLDFIAFRRPRLGEGIFEGGNRPKRRAEVYLLGWRWNVGLPFSRGGKPLGSLSLYFPLSMAMTFSVMA